MRRVSDICHGCRRCFNLCNSFPKLFDLVDKSPSGEIDTVPSPALATVADDCTLCDLCFLTKCPYVPPHQFNVDFPSVMLRYRIVANQTAKSDLVGKVPGAPTVAATTGFQNLGHESGSVSHTPDLAAPGTERALSLSAPSKLDGILTNVDFLGRVATLVPGLVNHSLTPNTPLRKIVNQVADFHPKGLLPSYVSRSETFMSQWEKKEKDRPVNKEAPAFNHKHKAVLFASCLGNYNMPQLPVAAVRVLKHFGVDVSVVYPSCCGMPSLERGDIPAVQRSAQALLAATKPFLDANPNARIVAPIASCGLMMRQHYSMLFPTDPEIKRLAAAIVDVSEYAQLLARDGIPATKDTDGVAPKTPAHVHLHRACHSRAQNVGNKAGELLRMLPNPPTMTVVEKCSGHGGLWGCKSEHHETALAVGAPAAAQIEKAELAAKKKSEEGGTCVSSECPIAGLHLKEMLQDRNSSAATSQFLHPIEVFARALGLM
eukprot:TRINITY_DN6729_c0_g1_i1.p1 TRINITY_DN6729_c0_g1~~TRINITY_DN6729_c0_g1_i1.p1  ORF type:complete len:561 (+),score=114.59 TRINITY_DN6729_c0_g1_i1:225-1685(+)